MDKLFSLVDFAEHLASVVARDYLVLESGLEIAASHVEKVAKDEFGHYQPEVGPFPAWEELAESTQMDRLHQGYDPDEPLLRTGGLRDSIEHEVHGLEAVIGSKSQIMVYHEFGTEHIPPRPVLGPAVVRSRPMIEKVFAEVVITGLIAGESLPAGLGYDATVGSSE